MTRSRGLALALAILSAGFFLIPTSAFAAETVINFDDQAAHTTISNQYASEGVTFDQRPSGPAELHPFIATPSSGEAHSPPNVLDISQKCGSEFPEAMLWGRFAVPRNHVSLFVGNINPGEGFPGSVTLQGFDLGGNPIPGATDKVSFSGFGISTEATISSSESEISYFEVAGPGLLCHVGIDDLSFETPPSTIPPDFGLSAPSIGPTLTPGGSATVTLGLHRNSNVGWSDLIQRERRTGWRSEQHHSQPEQRP